MICGSCAPVSGCGRAGVTIGPSVYSCRSVPQMPHIRAEQHLSRFGGTWLGNVLDDSWRAPWNRNARMLTSPSRRVIAVRIIGRPRAGFQIARDAGGVPAGPLVGVLDEFQRVTVGIGEVHPAPAGQDPSSTTLMSE